MSVTQRITCDFCGRSFGSYEGDVKPLVVKLEGPVVKDQPTAEKKSAIGQVQAVSVESSHIDHDRAIDATDACGDCYQALRQFIEGRRKSTKAATAKKTRRH